MTMTIVTANRLIEGDVVYLAAGGSWCPAIDTAIVARSQEEAEGLLAIAAEAEARQLVVGAYAIQVAEGEGARLVPVRNKEWIRAFGPTVHPEFARFDVPEELVAASGLLPVQQGSARHV